jgi:hypothetical protein
MQHDSHTHVCLLVSERERRAAAERRECRTMHAGRFAARSSWITSAMRVQVFGPALLLFWGECAHHAREFFPEYVSSHYDSLKRIFSGS